MGKVCHLCGSVANAVCMRTCFHCNVFTLHMYCMETISHSVPEAWICGYCLRSYGDKEVQSTCTTGKIAENNWCIDAAKASDPKTKALEYAKVKFLPAEEVILLSSGAKSRVPKRPCSRISSTLPDISENTSKRRITLCNIPTHVPRVNLCVTGASEQILLPKDVKNITRPSPHLSRIQYGPIISGLYSNAFESGAKGVGGDKDCSQKSIVACPNIAYKGCNGRNNVPQSHSVSCCTAEQRYVEQLPLLTKTHAKSINEPELCWRGIISAFSDDFCIKCGMKAHFAKPVLDKLYEASMRMPENLELKIVPRLHVWPKIFLVDPPRSNDIGLYFLPSDAERSQEMCALLVNHLDTRDLALKCSVGDVELLVYSTSQLRGFSRSSVPKTYLFAIFRHKRMKLSLTIQNELSDDTPSSSCHQSASLSITKLNDANEMNRRIVESVVDQLGFPPGFEKSKPQANHGKCPGFKCAPEFKKSDRKHTY